MTEPLTPDEVTDLISSGVTLWSDQKLEAIDGLECQIGAFAYAMRLFREGVDRTAQQAIEFAKAYRRLAR